MRIRTFDVGGVRVLDTSCTIAMSSEPDVKTVLCLSVVAGLDILTEVLAVGDVSICRVDCEISSDKATLTYFRISPLRTSLTLCPRNSEAEVRSMYQFCLKIPKLVASPDLPSPGMHDRVS